MQDTPTCRPEVVKEIAGGSCDWGRRPRRYCAGLRSGPAFPVRNRPNNSDLAPGKNHDCCWISARKSSVLRKIRLIPSMRLFPAAWTAITSALRLLGLPPPFPRILHRFLLSAGDVGKPKSSQRYLKFSALISDQGHGKNCESRNGAKGAKVRRNNHCSFFACLASWRDNIFFHYGW